MSEAGAPFSGVLYAGLMIDENGPKLIEYNVRFGDPECQVLMMRLQSDLVPILSASAEGNLSEQSVQWSDDTSLTIVMAANGYPGSYEKGSLISKLDEISDQSIQVFHAGTEVRGDDFYAIGGRVLCVTSNAPTATEAQKLAYAAVNQIDWPGGFWRTDIGHRAVERES